MQGIEITDRQKQVWNDIGDTLSASLSIKHLALQYYLEYRQSLINNKVVIEETEKINNIMRIAYFVSEKNQVVYNMRGEKVIGVALSINQIIKKNNDFEDFFLHLKEMLKVITIQDKEVERQIQTSLKKFKFTMTFHHKFVSTFNKIKPPHPQSNLARSLLWLLFILTKQAMHTTNDDIIEATCLMATSFIYYLKQAVKYFHQKERMMLDDNKFGGQLSNDYEIQHVILEYFRIKDMDKYQKVQTKFYQLLRALQSKIGSDTLFFHSYQRNLDVVYKKMDQIYQKKLSDQNIDQRHFLKQRINNVLFANRFTPFGGRRAIGKNKSPQTTNQIFSHRILHYENDDNQQTRVPLHDKPKQTREKCGQNLLKNLVANKTPTRGTPLIRATPTTNAMQMYNWVLQKSSYHRYDPMSKQLPINLIIKDGKTLTDNAQQSFKLIYGLWKDLCENLNEGNPSMKENDVYLILAVQVVYFVRNVNQNSLENLVKNFALTWLEIWEKIDLVLRYDVGMPRSIKQHLLAVQTNIIVKQLWTMQHPPLHIFTKQNSTQTSQTSERLYNRIIHELVYQIYFLCKKIQNFQQQEMNLIFMVSQYALANHPQILAKRSLYQIIICSFVLPAKIHKLELPFTSIVFPFAELNGISKQYYPELIEKIVAGDSNKTMTIVEFFNRVFVPAIKQVVIMLKCEEGSKEFCHYYKNITEKIMNSSVKDLLPKKMVIMAQKKSKTTSVSSTPQLQTPMTQALLAYNQSPLLKERRIKNLMNCIDGKRLIKNNKLDDDRTRDQKLNQTKAMINQKWKNSKSPDLRFGTTIRKTSANNQSK